MRKDVAVSSFDLICALRWLSMNTTKMGLIVVLPRKTLSRSTTFLLAAEVRCRFMVNTRLVTSDVCLRFKLPAAMAAHKSFGIRQVGIIWSTGTIIRWVNMIR
jgi:hypothetical protein